MWQFYINPDLTIMSPAFYVISWIVKPVIFECIIDCLLHMFLFRIRIRRRKKKSEKSSHTIYQPPRVKKRVRHMYSLQEKSIRSSYFIPVGAQ